MEECSRFGLTSTPLERARILRREKIIALRENGLSLEKIKNELGCSKSTVLRWLKRIDEESSLTSKRKSGRYRVTSRETDDAIVEFAEKNPQATLLEIADKFGLTDKVCLETVRKRLRERGLIYRALSSEGSNTKTHLWVKHQPLKKMKYSNELPSMSATNNPNITPNNRDAKFPPDGSHETNEGVDNVMKLLEIKHQSQMEELKEDDTNSKYLPMDESLNKNTSLPCYSSNQPIGSQTNNSSSNGSRLKDENFDYDKEKELHRLNVIKSQLLKADLHDLNNFVNIPPC